MNEFKGKTKVQLEALKIGLESYMQAHTDFINVMKDYHDHTINLLKQKLAVCEAEIDKVSE